MGERCGEQQAYNFLSFFGWRDWSRLEHGIDNLDLEP